MRLVTIRVTRAEAAQLLAYAEHHDMIREHFEARHTSLLEVLRRALEKHRATSTSTDAP